jgi:hypothetical protein
MNSPFEKDQIGEWSAFDFQISSAAEMKRAIRNCDLNGCSRSAGIGVHDRPELMKGRNVTPAQIEKAFTLRRNCCSR